MRKSLGAQSYIFPLPVLIIGTYSEKDVPDAMNAAWGTISDFNQVVLYLSAEHKTFENIRKRKAFTVSFADEGHVVACDFVGIVSANKDEKKFEKSGFTATKSENVDAPVINELPLTLECTLDTIDEERECVYGKIVNVLADESVLTDGKVDLKKLRSISYNPADRSYYGMGDKVGTAFHDGAALKK